MAYKSLPSAYSILWSRFKIVALLVFCGIVLISTIQMLRTYFKSKQATNEVFALQQNFKNKQTELNADIALFESDFGKEALLRERYGYIKEGEKAIFITSSRQAVSVDTKDTSENTPILKTFWAKVKTIFSDSQ